MVLVPCLRRCQLLLPFALASSVWADYYIDDTNATLAYFSGPKVAWGAFATGVKTLKLLLPNDTYQVIDATVCYNHTYRYAPCFDTDNCEVTIPFTGSGITIYVYQAGPVGINATITVDSAITQTQVLNAPPAPAYEIANVSMFNIQGLPSNLHTLQLSINDLSGSHSAMMFDYAYVNESFVSYDSTSTTTNTFTSATATSASMNISATATSASMYTSATTTSVSASASAIANPSSSSHTNIAAIVGSVVGATALLVAGVVAFLWIRRRRRMLPEMTDLHVNALSPPGQHDPAFPYAQGTVDPYPGYKPPMNATAGNDLASPQELDPPSIMPLVPNRPTMSDVRTTSTSLDSARERPTSSTVRNSTGLMSSSNMTSTATPESQLHKERSTSPSDTRPDSERPSLLTDAQADFINSLHQNNVPAAAIAHVMERMFVDSHAGIREWERETRLAQSDTASTAPPSYDLVAEMG